MLTPRLLIDQVAWLCWGRATHPKLACLVIPVYVGTRSSLVSVLKPLAKTAPTRPPIPPTIRILVSIVMRA